VRERVLDAGAELASRNLVAKGLPPLPHITPHSMRRTYVSIMLYASKFNVPFVQSQVGHEDSKLTMDVYAQLLNRTKQAHGVAFDAFVSEAQAVLYGAQSGDFSPLFCPPSDFEPSADICPPPGIGLDKGETGDGRGRFRTADLSRVKSHVAPADLGRFPCKFVVSKLRADLWKPADLGPFRLGLGPRAAPWA
jgi:hypothetical protein